MTAWHVAGADLDSQNYDQRTALHIAVAENNEDIVRFLISQVRYFFLDTESKTCHFRDVILSIKIVLVDHRLMRLTKIIRR